LKSKTTFKDEFHKAPAAPASTTDAPADSTQMAKI